MKKLILLIAMMFVTQFVYAEGPYGGPGALFILRAIFIITIVLIISVIGFSYWRKEEISWKSIVIIIGLPFLLYNYLFEHLFVVTLLLIGGFGLLSNTLNEKNIQYYFLSAGLMYFLFIFIFSLKESHGVKQDYRPETPTATAVFSEVTTPKRRSAIITPDLPGHLASPKRHHSFENE